MNEVQCTYWNPEKNASAVSSVTSTSKQSLIVASSVTQDSRFFLLENYQHELEPSTFMFNCLRPNENVKPICLEFTYTKKRLISRDPKH